MRHFIVASLVLAVTLAACDLLAVHPTVPVGAFNDTDMAVLVRVNGKQVELLPPGSSLSGDAADPMPPFTVEAMSSTGRVLVRLDVGAGDVADALSAGRVALEVLPCGRVILWAGPPPSLPKPLGEAREPCEP